MLINIVMLSDEDNIVTDIVGLDDFREADKVEKELSAKYGRNRVARTSLKVNQLPVFWGLTNEEPPNKARTRRGAGGASESQNPVAPRG